MVFNRFDGLSHVGKQSADRFASVSQAPFREVNLSVIGEKLKDTSPARGDSTTIEGFQVFQSNGFPLLIGHSFTG
jgi:hypothetical protein